MQSILRIKQRRSILPAVIIFAEPKVGAAND